MTSWLLKWENSWRALRLNNLITVKLTVKTKSNSQNKDMYISLPLIRYDSQVIIVRVLLACQE